MKSESPGMTAENEALLREEAVNQDAFSREWR